MLKSMEMSDINQNEDVIKELDDEIIISGL